MIKIKSLRIIGLEFYLDLRAYTRYKFAFVSDLIIFFIMQTFFLLMNTGQSLESSYGSGYDGTGLMLIGYFTWMLASACISNCGSEIYREISTGTFYQKINSVLPIQVLVLGKLLSSIVTQCVVAAILVAYAYLFWGVSIYINAYIIAVIFICLVGMYGIGLLLGGFYIYFKKAGSLTMIIQMALLFTSNILTDNNPIGSYFRFLPLSQCVDFIRRISVGMVIGLSELIMYLLSCIVTFAVGYIAVNLFIKKAKKDGVLLLT